MKSITVRELLSKILQSELQLDDIVNVLYDQKLLGVHSIRGVDEELTLLAHDIDSED